MMPMKYWKIFILFINLSSVLSQIIYEQTIYEDGQELDVFAYQLPENFNPDLTYPLLVAFHQWGGNHMSPFSTNFDEEANDRNWIFLCPFGGSSNNYNHQGAQYMVKKTLEWMIDNHNINENKIYMVGGSMGGASGMIYANNHLNPEEPMVAATASASGILDCERRAIEMDGNNSMIEWFGGNWDEFPFEYHRNSAIYFADSTQSMHYNLKYTPLYFDFGITEPHRTHAEEMYDIMNGYNDYLWIDQDPEGSHGFSVFDENHVCNWLNQFELRNNPDSINVNLDEPSRAYWIEAHNQLSNDNFIKIDARKDNNYIISIDQYLNSDSLILHLLDEEYLGDNNITFYIDAKSNNVGFSGPLFNGANITNINALASNDTLCTLFNFNTDENNIIWIERYDLYNGTCLDYGPYTISFNFLTPEDVNQDGQWDIIDIVLIINHILNIDILTGVQIDNADLNNDSIVDILDIINLVNIILSN